MSQTETPIYPSELIIIRHGLSELNVRKAIAVATEQADTYTVEPIRDADVPLTDVGRRQAFETGREMSQRFDKIDIAYVSPFVRTRDTFLEIQRGLGYDISVSYEDRVREREFGIFSQLTMLGIEKHYPQEAARMRLEGDYYYRPLGGESYPDMGVRLHSWLHSLYQHQCGKRVLCVTHADVVQMIRKMLERLTEAQLLELNRSDDVHNCGVTSYHYDPHVDYLKLTNYNEILFQ